jgi:hypothetical protein
LSTVNDPAPAPAGSLARALAARTAAQLPTEWNREECVAAFAAVVAELDAADDAYQAAIGAHLSASKAQATLAALADFRLRVGDIRARVRSAVDYGDFDPLDTYVPTPRGSHGDAVRAASATDAARGEVAYMRARVNEQIGALLEREDIEQLTTAKRARNAAFDRSLRAALPARVTDKLATQLLLLVDAWY